MQQAASGGALRIWRPSPGLRIVLALAVAGAFGLELWLAGSGSGGHGVLERLAKAGIAAGVLVLFMRGRLELHPAHLAIRTLFRSHVIPLADIAMISFGRSGLVFTCGNGRRVVGPMGVGEQTLLSYWLGTRSSGNDIIDTIGDARKRCVRSSVAGG